MARRDYGTGSIRARGPGRWEVRWADPPDPVSGERRRRSKTITGKKTDATALLARMSSTTRGVDTSALTLGDTIDRWRAGAEHELGTQRNYDLARRAIPARILATPLAKIDEAVFGLAVDHAKKEHGPHRARLVHALISGALRHAYERHWIEENISPRVRRPTVKRRRLTEPTPAQVEQMKAAVAKDPQLSAWLTVAADTGARRSEVLALQWRNVNLELGSVFIEHAIDPIDAHLKGTKTGNVRPVAIGARTVEALTAWRTAAEKRASDIGVTLDPDSFVFSAEPDSSAPWRPDSATKRFGKIRRAVGVEGVRLNDLRHYVATNLLAAGYDSKNVAGRLGHTRVATTEDIYASRLPTRDRDMAEHLQTLG